MDVNPYESPQTAGRYPAKRRITIYDPTVIVGIVVGLIAALTLILILGIEVVAMLWIVLAVIAILILLTVYGFAGARAVARHIQRTR